MKQFALCIVLILALVGIASAEKEAKEYGNDIKANMDKIGAIEKNCGGSCSLEQVKEIEQINNDTIGIHDAVVDAASKFPPNSSNQQRFVITAQLAKTMMCINFTSLADKYLKLKQVDSAKDYYRKVVIECDKVAPKDVQKAKFALEDIKDGKYK